MGETGFDSSDEAIARRVKVGGLTITYRIEGDLLLTRIEGPTGYEDVRRYLDTLFADPRYMTGMSGLIDCRGVKSLFTVADLRKLAADIKHRPELRARSKSAVIASSNLVYGLLRMYEVFSEGDPVEMRVFRKPEEAMAWLLGQEE
jgi:hypothetical protein